MMGLATWWGRGRGRCAGRRGFSGPTRFGRAGDVVGRPSTRHRLSRNHSGSSSNWVFSSTTRFCPIV
ncbi:hypothetical protein BHE74_00010865 [Ensete ventricosum]|nr:hypothetical protein BHE74_00010865 [Ensete ventricosum]